MVLRNEKTNLNMVQSLAPNTRTTGSVNGSAVDLQGYDAAMAGVSIGDYTDGTHSLKLQHSDDGIAFSDVETTELDGEHVTLESTTLENTVVKIGYLGSKRYLRVVSDVTGATSGANTAAYILLGKPHHAPV